MGNKAKKVDVEVSGGGTVYLLSGLTEAGRSWMDENLPSDAQKLGEAVAVEHRYVGEIVQGMRDDGLRVA